MMGTWAEHEALVKTPEWAAYLRRSAEVKTRLGNALRELPFDINGVLIKTGDRVRSTLGLDGFNIREGIAKLSDEPGLPNCIEVDGCTSAASLWEIVSSSPIWTPCRWTLGDTQVYIELVRSSRTTCYAVRRGNSVLAKDGEWEYEPMPSNRDDAFLARCRFTSFDDAIAAYARTVPPC